MQPENSPGSSELYRIMAGTGAVNVGSYGFQENYDFPSMESFCGSSVYPLELSGISDTPQARALAALKNHKEAEKRRRARINSHLDKLRSLLPCNSKVLSLSLSLSLHIYTRARAHMLSATDKASLLAKVVERVKELKQQTSELMELDTFPVETDEITVYSATEFPHEGQLIFKASLCCEDRSDLLPDLIEILKSLHLKTLRAEMSTLGGRVRSILIVAGDKEHSIEAVHFLQNALKGLIERSSSNDQRKRRRILDHRAIA
nr:basic helix-loop-helix transcription factor [Loropetalum chinense var. rubrum]